MAVCKHKNGKTYTYEFTYNGVRFRGSTGQETKREALKVEARLRAEIESASGDAVVKRKPDMRLRDATGRYWKEKGQFGKDEVTVFGQLGRLVDDLGPDTLLRQISTDDLARYQSKQRAARNLANSTLNAEIGLLRRVVKRAQKVWGVNVAEDAIAWSELKLEIPMHRTRTMSRVEEVQVLRKLRVDYRPFVRFALMTGLRRTALILRKDQIDWDARIITYNRKSKRSNNKGFIPVTAAVERLLKREIAKSPADCEYVFTYVCKRGNKYHKTGQRYPVTYSGMRRPIEKAIKAVGLTDWRLMHDMRHTAATNTLRRSKNLKAIQMMLGHSDIGQTSKYAHALIDDVREAMEAGSRNSPVIQKITETQNVSGI